MIQGRVLRRVNKMDRAWGPGLTEKAVGTSEEGSQVAGIATSSSPRPTPDLRSAVSRVGGELEQIQFLLGHVSIQSTERHLGCKQHPIGGQRQNRDRTERTRMTNDGLPTNQT